MTEQPLVMFDWATMFCPRHGEPFRPTWPAGAATALTTMFQKAALMPAVMDASGRDPVTGLADANGLSAALKRFAPLCCFVSREDLAAVYAAAGVAT